MENKKNVAVTKTKSNAIAIPDKTYMMDKPRQVAQMALVLKTHVVKNNLYTNIVGKNYAHVEGWQFAGGLLGLYPRVARVENLSTKDEIKWKADVEIIDKKTGLVVGNGFALCSNKENKKKSFDEYAILSMAQTRAIGKSFRNLLGWVMKMAGYEGTPSEEMMKVGQEAPQGQPGVVTASEPATKSQNVTIEKLCKEMGYNDPDKAYLFIKKTTGIDFTTDLTKADASKIIATLLNKQVKKNG